MVCRTMSALNTTWHDTDKLSGDNESRLKHTIELGSLSLGDKALQTS